jgi:acetyl-CoA carboxylase carboxyltransferase component
MKAKGESVTLEQEKEILTKIAANYTRQTTPYYAASRLWVDAIIDPKETRMVIAKGIEAANHNPVIEEMKVGVFQV